MPAKPDAASHGGDHADDAATAAAAAAAAATASGTVAAEDVAGAGAGLGGQLFERAPAYPLSDRGRRAAAPARKGGAAAPPAQNAAARDENSQENGRAADAAAPPTAKAEASELRALREGLGLAETPLEAVQLLVGKLRLPTLRAAMADLGLSASDDEDKATLTGRLTQALA